MCGCNTDLFSTSLMFLAVTAACKLHPKGCYQSASFLRERTPCRLLPGIFLSSCFWTFWQLAASTADVDKRSKLNTYLCLNFKPENQINNTRFKVISVQLLILVFQLTQGLYYYNRCTNRQVSLEIQVSESGLTVFMSKTERTI